uniref:SFRICE_034490 n=1 Tax=Spodoptera frugiperda TaxID=7108 RepID=A0A2H1WI96_SPOFR
MPLYNVQLYTRLCYKSQVIGVSLLPYGTMLDSVQLLRNFRKFEISPIICCATQESNPRPLAQQSHLRSLDQRGSHVCCMSKRLKVNKCVVGVCVAWRRAEVGAGRLGAVRVALCRISE